MVSLLFKRYHISPVVCEKMKSIIKIGQILSIIIFISGVTLYLLFAILYPLLHNHPIDGKHHPNCPACNFLIIASFANIPEVIIVSAIFLQIIYQVFFNYQQPYTQSVHKSHSSRSPPMMSA